ncbi:NAD+ synthase [Methanocella sp. CWC-04]|uniref:NH(3)-dependent NAD(+) synthetase n=1 Tax=Methanooceanicella nereidis TaxID=2052831 RepID=A0AAP2W5W6_9EURY|nr:NAD+ synthase [Methanocella sp. CWC-04]MCD1294733.1 NAD+ synthase [Methanocella sp. CWC-04]
MEGLELSKESLVKCENKIMESIVRVVELSNSNGAILAISGGIDSALVATLASRVVDVYGLIMPDSTSTDPDDIQHARELAESLGIDYEIIDISSIVQAIYRSRPELGPEECKLAYANVKPRVRMIMNYFAANLDGRIVLGTGNKTELCLGYFTKYGDGGVDILPIGDLYKTRVWQLSRHLGIPEHIVSKAPSAGLWKGQTDEAELGLSYKTADMILYAMFDKGLTREQIKKETGVDDESIDKVMQRIRGSEHKRIMPPIVKLDV